MQTSLFDYDLPSDRIAQHSVEPRDQAKMLVLNRSNKTWKDRRILDLPDFLRPGDLLIFNNSKVFKARIRAQDKTGRGVEIFLLRPDLPLTKGETKRGWLGLAKPAKKLKPGNQLTLSDGSSVIVVDKTVDGIARLDFQKSAEEVFALADRIGEIPVPPYITSPSVSPSARGRVYQTIYADKIGSVAAPTAGFHFTPRLFEALEKRGVKKAFVTLHVGLGTFRPMKSETLEEHIMHEEWAEIPQETWNLIEQTKRAGHRVIAVGTTAVRALESMPGRGGVTPPLRGFTNLFITPGYQFKVIDGLLTNFHLPKSTLLVLVSSFAGREFILDAYRHAIENNYRFFSFGDAMLIL